MGEPEGFSKYYKLNKDALYSECRRRRIAVTMDHTKIHMARELARSDKRKVIYTRPSRRLGDVINEYVTSDLSSRGSHSLYCPFLER